MNEKSAPGTQFGRNKLLPLEVRVLGTVRKYRMIESGELILVGISGGADSSALVVCLNHLAPRLGIKLSAAHLNHGLRGAESDGDEEFARKLSADLGLPFFAEALAPGELPGAASRNLEEAARNVRYDFLRRAARRAHAAKIAVGHTMNDQAETVLMRLFRGSGVEGMSAIHPVLGGIVIRPFLECSRQEILAYLEQRNVGYREDSSNRDRRFRRSLLRHEWIPYIENNFNPRLIKTLAREAELAREVADFLKPLALTEYTRLRRRKENAIVLPAVELSQDHVVIRNLVLREALREARGSLRGITSAHLERLLHLCLPGRSGRRVELPDGTVVAREFQNLLFTKGPAAEYSFCYHLPVPGRCVVPEAGVEISAHLGSLSSPPERSCRAFLSAVALPASLVARSRMPGDRYGGPGHRKVKKMLINAKIDLHERATLPVIASGEIVVWIPGFEPAKQFRARPEAGMNVVIEIKKIHQ